MSNAVLSAINGGDLFGLTGGPAKVIAWVLFVFFSAMLLITLPLCYAEQEVAVLADRGWALCAYHDASWLGWLTVDHSAGTIVCLAVFFGVCIRVIEHCRRFEKLEQTLSTIDSTSAARRCSDPDLELLFDGIGRDIVDNQKVPRLLGFQRNLMGETRIDEYEYYLVAIGLIGTLAFYFGFAERLTGEMSYASLDTTARELLTVVGTAAISSVAGLVLGMLAARKMAGYVTQRRKRVLTLAFQVMEGL